MKRGRKEGDKEEKRGEEKKRGRELREVLEGLRRDETGESGRREEEE